MRRGKTKAVCTVLALPPRIRWNRPPARPWHDLGGSGFVSGSLVRDWCESNASASHRVCGCLAALSPRRTDNDIDAVNGCFRSSGYFDIWQNFEYSRLEAVRAAGTSISGKSSSTRGCGGGGVQALYSLFRVGAVPRPHHSPKYRDNPRPGLEYRGNPIPSPFPPNQPRRCWSDTGKTESAWPWPLRPNMTSGR
jgi:hypothetical protein